MKSYYFVLNDWLVKETDDQKRFNYAKFCGHYPTKEQALEEAKFRWDIIPDESKPEHVVGAYEAQIPEDAADEVGAALESDYKVLVEYKK